jgi:hypothetical protein
VKNSKLSSILLDEGFNLKYKYLNNQAKEKRKIVSLHLENTGLILKMTKKAKISRVRVALK